MTDYLTEINTKEFQVERSGDGINFKPIATKAAEGNSNSGRVYRFIDAPATPGDYHYRIRSIDIDGKETFSDVKNLAYGVESAMIKAGPNPFQNSLTVTNLSNVIRIDLVDLNGRIVLTHLIKTDKTVSLETNQLPAGLYQLKSSKKDGTFTTIKVIKL